MKIKFSGRSQQLKDNYTFDEEKQLYEDSLREVYENPRWFLDNLDKLSSFRVSWKDYRYTSPVLPYKYTLKGKN